MSSSRQLLCKPKTRTHFTNSTEHKVGCVCRTVLKNHLKVHREYALRCIAKIAMQKFDSSCDHERLQNQNLERPKLTSARFSRRIEHSSKNIDEYDIALQSLKAIICSLRRKPKTIKMPKVSSVPKYDAWVPVKRSYRISDELSIEPYMPYLGDAEGNRAAAYNYNKSMEKDAKRTEELSDSETAVISQGSYRCEGKRWSEYYALHNILFREACRAAIIQVLSDFGDSPQVRKGLCQGLNIKPIRLNHMIRIALRRAAWKDVREKEKTERSMARNEVLAAYENVQKITKLTVGELTRQGMRYFCCTCQIFLCDQHDGRNLYPVSPTRDILQEQRLKTIQKIICGDMKMKAAALMEPCSEYCSFLSSAHRLVAFSTAFPRPWSDLEEKILLEVMPVFGYDPCSLAVIIGSKTCHQVWKKLTTEHSVGVEGCAVLFKTTPAYDEKMKSFISACIKKRKAEFQKLFKKDIEYRKENSTESDTDEEYSPCYHEGDCTVNNCSCARRMFSCEVSCGCSNIRFCQGLHGQGVSRFVDRSKRFGGDLGLCMNLTPGCNCLKNHCNTNICPCWKRKRACNPDICEGCDCNQLPSKISQKARTCRNISAAFTKNKRTIIGKSAIHGFGLFAGDFFDKGELVAIYAGLLPNRFQAEILDNLYELKGQTFFFDIFTGKVIDAGCLGSTARFANHAVEAKANCAGRLMRVRGDGVIGLYSIRTICPGEELRFDYKFVGSSQPDWLLNLEQMDDRKPLPQVELL